MTPYFMKSGDPTDRRITVGQCIYCGSEPIGEEHIIPQGVGGTLVLGKASCGDCEETINRFEANVLNTVLYVPRVAAAFAVSEEKTANQTESALWQKWTVRMSR